MTEHEQMLEHAKRLARLDAGYARWRCGMLALECPEEFRTLLRELDAWLKQEQIAIPKPFDEWMATLK